MSVLRRTLVTAPAALGLLAATAFPAEAHAPLARTLFSWNGTIDREVVLVIRGRSVETRASGLDASFAPRLDVREALPRQVGDLDVQLAAGRGEVEVLQRPSARNDYTGMVRVADPRGGRDNYRLVVSFVPSGSTNDPWGVTRDEGRDRNDDVDNDGNRNRGRSDNAGRGRGNGGWDDGWDDGRNTGRGNGRNTNRNSSLISWRGDVDDVVDIRIQGRRVEYRTRSGQPVRNADYDLSGQGLPRRRVTIEPDVANGRGDVTVIQQPSASNGYTAIIRVEDQRRGYGRYDFDLRWY